MTWKEERLKTWQQDKKFKSNRVMVSKLQATGRGWIGKKLRRG
jgi:hypothetical protein